jgi:hypothetical protein
MKTTLGSALKSLCAGACVALFVVAAGGSAAMAGPVERACNASGRSQATPRLCTCIQQTADALLSWNEQRRAAGFFSDPHEAQEVRQSGRAADEVFWQRYRAFGEAAEARCAGA